MCFPDCCVSFAFRCMSIPNKYQIKVVDNDSISDVSNVAVVVLGFYILPTANVIRRRDLAERLVMLVRKYVQTQ